MDICADGMMWSRAFALCLVCPENSYSFSGDIGCASCPPSHFSPKQSAACFPNNAVGGVFRLNADFDTWDSPAFMRELAILLDTEPQYINVILNRPGSVIIYFTIDDPSNIRNSDSNIRKLSGNEKMLLLYQWWIQDDDRLKELSVPIMNFNIYSFELVKNQEGDLVQDVITLFEEDYTLEPIIPQLPGDFDTSNGAFSVQSAYPQKETFYFTLSVDDVGVNNSSRIAVTSLFLLTITILLSLF